MIRKVIAIVLLGVFGLVLLPFEKSLGTQQKAVGLRSVPLDLDLRERLGQMGFLAALSGFRSGLAAVLWIKAYTAWERTEWGRMAGIFNTVTTLQPRSTLYWDMAAWHMAWNASIAAFDDKTQPSEALRIRNQRQFINLGRDYLEQGVRNNPQSAFLQEHLAVLLRDKLEDHCGSGEAFLRSSQLPDTTPYAARFAGYELSKCPGREREAYDLLKKLYKNPKERKPTLISILKELEKSLDIPPSDRIDSPEP